MNSSWVFLGVSILFVAFATTLVLRPLLRRKPAAARVGRRNINIAVYRDQLKEMEADRANGLISEEQFAVAKLELEARLAQDAVDSEDVVPVNRSGRWLGVGLGVLIPVAAFSLYFLFGNVQALEDRGGIPSQADIQAMLQSAEDKVKADPNDTQTWAMLARAYSAMERWPDAIRAFDNLARLAPDEASVWSHYGEALALANDRNLDGKPMELINKALALDPKDTKALELSGIYAYQNKDYKKAVKFWQQVVDLSPPGDQYTLEMQGALDKARELAGETASNVQKLDNLSSFSGGASAAADKGVSGTVSLAGSLKDKVTPNDTVFVFARDEQGPPLAAERLTVAQLPASFDLNDSQSMGSGNAISGYASVNLVARVSKSGNAMPQPGDLEGELKAVKVGSKNIKLVIDRVR